MDDAMEAAIKEEMNNSLSILTEDTYRFSPRGIEHLYLKHVLSSNGYLTKEYKSKIREVEDILDYIINVDLTKAFTKPVDNALKNSVMETLDKLEKLLGTISNGRYPAPGTAGIQQENRYTFQEEINNIRTYLEKVRQADDARKYPWYEGVLFKESEIEFTTLALHVMSFIWKLDFCPWDEIDTRDFPDLIKVSEALDPCKETLYFCEECNTIFKSPRKPSVCPACGQKLTTILSTEGYVFRNRKDTIPSIRRAALPEQAAYRNYQSEAALNHVLGDVSFDAYIKGKKH